MSCKGCIRYNNCPDPFTKQLISDIFDDQEAEDMSANMDKLCSDYCKDPTNDPEFIITIWKMGNNK